jgi:hypothetical protein
MFPPLADEWWKQFQAQKNWEHFTRADFLRLQKKYQVGWVVLQADATRGLSCPYKNSVVAVCTIG